MVLPALTGNVVGVIPVVGAPLITNESMWTVPGWFAVNVTIIR